MDLWNQAVHWCQGFRLPHSMDEALAMAGRLFTTPPWYYLSWPAAAMVLGTLVGMFSKDLSARLAIVPRTGGGLVGILTAPFVHTGPGHLLANLPPFLVLGSLVLHRGQTGFPGIAAAIALLQGMLLWAFGRRAAHVGMSGVIFGFFGYLVALAWLTQGSGDIIVAGIVIVFYGGILMGLAPARDGSSWEGHLFGLVAGLGTAWMQYRM
jgi:membrane associated rhomboid family serine protease